MTTEPPKYPGYHPWPAAIRIDHIPHQRYGVLLSAPTWIDKDGVEWPPLIGGPCDGGSIPRLFWRLIGHPYNPRYLAAYASHDSDCERARIIYETGDLTAGYDYRLATDRRFYDQLRWLGASRPYAAAKYRAVRLNADWNHLRYRLAK